MAPVEDFISCLFLMVIISFKMYVLPCHSCPASKSQLRAGTRVHERLGTGEDQMSVLHHILLCLPQNSQMKHCFYRGLSWPQLSYTAEGREWGHLAKMKKGPEDAPHRQTPTLTAKHTHQRLGLFRKLIPGFLSHGRDLQSLLCLPA